jgi:hypothetical protein
MVKDDPRCKFLHPTKYIIGIDDFVYLYKNSQDLGVALSDGSGVDGFGGTGGYLKYALDMSCEKTEDYTFFEDIDGE